MYKTFSKVFFVYYVNNPTNNKQIYKLKNKQYYHYNGKALLLLLKITVAYYFPLTQKVSDVTLTDLGERSLVLKDIFYYIRKFLN